MALALLMKDAPLFATVHAIGTFCCCGWIAATANDHKAVAKAIFYVMGAEVLWRMCKATIPWETGKYAVIGIIFAYALRQPKSGRPFWPVLFVLVLAPAVFMTLFDYPLADARMMISFNFLGPFSLALSAWWFHRRSFTKTELMHLLSAALIPLSGVLTITVLATYGGRVVFGDESNFATSGGFGPNQVSSILSLGCVLIFMVLFLSKWKSIQRVTLIGFMILFLAQSLMTFSRSGLYMAAGFIAIAIVLITVTRRQRIKVIIAAVVVFLITLNIVFPYLDRYTGGKLAERFTDTKASGRGDIFAGDIELFEENLFFGVGVGQSIEKRSIMSGIAPHSEVSRLLAEHGLLGLFSLLLFGYAAAVNFFNKKSNLERAFTAGIFVWVLGYLFVNATRIVAPSVFFGISFIALAENSSEDEPA